MAAKKNLPVTHVLAKALQFDCADKLGRFESGADVVRRILGVITNKERASPHKKIYSFLLGKSFVRRLPRFSRLLDKLIVTRPKRELVYQILRFDQINWRMPRTFDAFVAQ